MNQETKKKEYTKPEMEMMAFSHQTNLLLDCSDPGNDGCLHSGGTD